MLSLEETAIICTALKNEHHTVPELATVVCEQYTTDKFDKEVAIPLIYSMIRDGYLCRSANYCVYPTTTGIHLVKETLQFTRKMEYSVSGYFTN